MSPTPRRRPGPPPVDVRRTHRDWLALVDTNGPFLTLPILTQVWPDGLSQLDMEQWDLLRKQHARWIGAPGSGQDDWIRYVLEDLLGWGSLLGIEQPRVLDIFTVDVPEHDTRVLPSFVLARPGAQLGEPPAMFGMIVPDHQTPLNRYTDKAWAATPVDRMAQLCRRHEVPLGLVTNGRTWVLVYARRGAATTTAAFDATTWNESADEQLVRAFVSLLSRERFFSVPPAERLPELLAKSGSNQEEVTEQLGVQVRQAVELLVTAIGIFDAERQLDAEEAYWGAVTVMMRLVFLLFAEERGLLPADNEIYASGYAASTLYQQLDEELALGSTAELELSHTAWPRLIALFRAIHDGIDHDRLPLPAYDGSLFDPDTYPWLPGLVIDDLVVLNMLRSIQRVVIGRSRADREERELSFRALQVEQIGYVYEGLLSYEARRANHVVVGLIGRDGVEEEVTLRDLEALAEPHRLPTGGYDVRGLAQTLADRFEKSGIGSASALTRKLTPGDEAERTEARRWLRNVLGTNTDLVERLLPFAGTVPERRDGRQDEDDRGGIVRADLKHHPVIFTDGALYVTESPLRGNTGTHYTPQALAAEVVEGALEPLVYSPGPLETGDSKQWRRRSSDEILALKVADIACGSGAFLVASTRYLAARFIEAKISEKDPDYLPKNDAEVAVETIIDAEADPITIRARRLIIEHCVYGADINPMAVEMAKLSLWLVSMDAGRPLTFLDDRLVAGDSLLGITSLEQLEWMHLDIEAGKRLHAAQAGTDVDFTSGIRDVAAAVAAKRREIAAIDGDSIEHVEEKRRLLAEAAAQTGQAALFADLIAGAGLASRVKRDDIPWYRWDDRADASARGRLDLFLDAADQARQLFENPDREVIGEAVTGSVLNRGAGEQVQVGQAVRNQSRLWLETEMPAGDFGRHPVHWPLVFPEVFIGDDPGFDAVVGNPPFVGSQKMTAALGEAYREYLVEDIAGGKRGQADLVAYFLLRAHQLITRGGQTGLIATNTLAQGDTREVGLDQLVARGITIRRAIKSQRWQTKSAAVENCVVWTSCALLGDGAIRMLDGDQVDGITPSLDPAGRVVGTPKQLVENEDKSFIGSYVLGLGFTMSPDEAAVLLDRDERNSEVLFPYLNAKDLNSRPGCDASRWVIDFHDWNESKASTYTEPYEQVRRLVKPERDVNNRAVYRDKWWQYAERRPAMLGAISALRQVITIARVSKTLMPVVVTTEQVISEAVVIFASDDPAFLGILSSAPHYWWTIERASTLKGDARYTPSDVFETFPRPQPTEELRELGRRLLGFRSDFMLDENLGLTETYNRVHDESEQAPSIAQLREIHRLIDNATVRAYGWTDLLERNGGLGHGFHGTAQGMRYTVDDATRREILTRLLEENLRRYAAEEKAGLHRPEDKAARRRARRQATAGDAPIRRAAPPKPRGAKGGKKRTLIEGEVDLFSLVDDSKDVGF